MGKFVFLALPGNMFHVVREITRIKKRVLKMYDIKIQSRMCTRSIVNIHVYMKIC